MVNLGFSATIGVLLILAGLLFIFKKEGEAIVLGYATLLLSMTVANLLVFYFDQFSSIFIAMVQFVLFLGVLRYRVRFVELTPQDDAGAG